MQKLPLPLELEITHMAHLMPQESYVCHRDLNLITSKLQNDKLAVHSRSCTNVQVSYNWAISRVDKL